MTPRPKMWGIYREAGSAAKRSAGRFGYARPKRVAVIEAPTEKDALIAFGQAERIRSSHVRDFTVYGRKLHVTIVNGQNAHTATYVAWR